MDLTLLPYEILQLVATWLLPRQQCRLALTSRHCYQYLYNDLLRWHARKYRIPRVYYVIYSRKDMCVAVSRIPSRTPRVILATYCVEELYSYDLTNRRVTVVGKHLDTYDCITMHMNRNMNTGDEPYVEFKKLRSFDILAGNYQHIHKDILLMYINMMGPTFSLKLRIYRNIYNMLNSVDKRSLIAARII